MSRRYELAKLVKSHGIAKSKLPLLPIQASRISVKFQQSQLDMCSQRTGGCDRCGDLVKCRGIYDSLC